ncbi:YhgE/Pip domain-containing protein [Actinoplanes sp. NEAU-A12]|uniref:YhgE/Pip domain-containing protein n=1 Tax=Actinoplanes sandaracinus TaxID=3045177 RepID=A0ABT6WRH6_9ACTN|nr:YhgE/Pip domain-containing protein [Actinoplanes sandaracinus]MDI6102347.1 YhgE/Pip domain-containing protein [Actinoplanes sandaracinus]
MKIRRRLPHLGILLVPVLIAVALIAAFDRPADRLATVTAAVVNSDEPVQRDGQTVPLGRELAGRLVNDDGDNYTWVLTDAADAAEGLRTGGYAVAVTIPANFSAAAVSSGGDTPSQAEQARIDVTTSRAAAGVDPIVARMLTDAAVTTLNRTVVETYLDNVYVGFTTMHGQLGKAADGAGDLSDGAGKLADGSGRLVVGLNRLADGSADLATGLDRLATGGDDLADGVADLGDGAGDMATATRKLHDGATTLAEGTAGLATGTKQLATGTGQLSDGLGALAGSTAGLPQQTRALADGARQVADGNKQLADTVVPLADKAVSGIDALPDLTAEAARARALADQCETPADLCDQLRALADRIVTEAGGAETAKDRLRGQVVGVRDGITTLADGSRQVADGAAALAGQTPRLVTAIGQADTAARQLATGANQAATGAAGVDKGAQRLATGSGRLAGGASRLATGAGRAATGAEKLADGTADAAAGAGRLTGGAREAGDAGQQLADGSGKLAEGAGALSTSLGDGRDQVPTYTDAEREHLKTVAATPVAGDVHGIGGTGGLIAGAVIAIALWIGAMLIFLITPAAGRDPLAWHGATWRLAAVNARRPLLLAGAQAVLVTAAAGALLTPGPVELAALLLVDLLVSVTFLLVNQAIAVAFGNSGRILAVIVPVVVLAAAIVSGVPAWVTTLDGILPGHGPVLAIRAVTADAGLGPAGIAHTLAWLAVGAVGYLLATAHRRTTGPRIHGA